MHPFIYLELAKHNGDEAVTSAKSRTKWILLPAPMPPSFVQYFYCGISGPRLD